MGNKKRKLNKRKARYYSLLYITWYEIFFSFHTHYTNLTDEKNKNTDNDDKNTIIVIDKDVCDDNVSPVKKRLV